MERKIALNYSDHVIEMGAKTDRTAPFWFFKPTTSYLAEDSGPIVLPASAVVHHEGKVVVRQVQFFRKQVVSKLTHINLMNSGLIAC